MNNNIIGKQFKNPKNDKIFTVEEINESVAVISDEVGNVTNISLNYLVKNFKPIDGTLQVESLICG